MTTEVIYVDDDLFVVWESIVEAPTMWGRREDLLPLMEREMRFKFGQSADPQGPRFDRAAARRGGSYFEVSTPTTERSWIFEQRGLLRGAKMRDFLESYDPETGRFDLSLLEILEPGDEHFGHIRGYDDDGQ